MRVLIAHTNGGGEKRLRKLEPRLLAAGVTVTRTADDLPRYHGKMTHHRRRALRARLQLHQRRTSSAAAASASSPATRSCVKEAAALFEADSTRQPYTPGHDRFVVSPETSRERSVGADRQGPQAAAHLRRAHLRQADAAAAAGAGRRRRRDSGHRQARQADCRASPPARCPTCACTSGPSISDGTTAFIGSQSLRKPELDERREIGVIVKDARIARKMRAVFEADWALGKPRNAKRGRRRRAGY